MEQAVKDRISHLLVQQVKGALTMQESEELAQFAERYPEVKELADHLRTEQGLQAEMNDWYETPARAWEKLTAQMPGWQQENGTNGKVFPLTWWKLAAAGVVVILLASVAYLLLNRAPQQPLVQQVQATRFKNDVAPGTDKAILTLADGSTVVLDDNQNKIIGVQGTARIEKQGEKITYLNKGEATAQIIYNSIATPRGAQYRVQLSDGTLVMLNAASGIRFPTVFTGKERLVEITGEAWFEVAKNPHQPFRVKYKDITVEALGTKFNVNAYNDNEAATVAATLLEGSVRVSKAANNVLLQPGQQALVHNNENIQVLPAVDMDEILAWKNGDFQFQNVSIQSLMHEVARWYDVEVRYEGAITTHSFYGGIPRTVPLSELLKMLESTKWVHFKIDGKTITVMP